MAGSEGLSDDLAVKETVEVIVELVDKRNRNGREVRANPVVLRATEASGETADVGLGRAGLASGLLDVGPDSLNDFRRNLSAVVVDDANFIQNVHDKRFLIVVSEVGGGQTASLIPLASESTHGDLLGIDVVARPKDEEGEDAEVLLQKDGLNAVHGESPNKGVSGNQRHDLASGDVGSG